MPKPSLADGGAAAGGAAGGADSLDGVGGVGGNGGATGGGGGGAGAQGGNGGSGSTGVGGLGGLTPGASGQDGTGNSGGGGGAHGVIVVAPGVISSATGGNGGAGGGGAGGGGAGGYGAAITVSGAFTSSGTVAGGNGGNGANGFGGSGGIGIAFGVPGASLENVGAITGGIGGGSGGDGGAGIAGSGLAITNSVSGSITGGTGGIGSFEVHAAGGGGVGINASSSTIANSGSIRGGDVGDDDDGTGDGGAGITGSSLVIFNNSGGSITGGRWGSSGLTGDGVRASSTTITNSGSITGGLLDGGSTRANAITFTGGTNVLELRAGSTIVGNVVAFSVADTLRLGGSADASLDLSLVGPAAQFRGFGVFEKTGMGTWTLTGTTGVATPWTISQGTLAVNGSITGDVTVGPGGALGGSGTIFGNIVNTGILAPGNSIGTLNVSGNFVQNGGVYQVEVNAAGQSDRISVTGAPGTATINGGTVQVLAQPGNYGRTTTYTILNATGGVTGTFSAVTSNFAFLSPSLLYDPNNVFLVLTLAGFSFGALTPNQRATGTALDQAFASATGDFATALTALAALDTVQGPRALNALSGEPWASFGSMNTSASMLFMNAVGQQMAATRGGAAAGTRLALAQACDATACDSATPWSVWASALGGLGSVLGDGNASTLTYNFGGAAAGFDYRLDPRFLVGLAVGYTSGNLRVDSFQGQGWSDAASIAVYGSFAQGPFYADALAGYAHFDNRLLRPISFPGLQRTANGNTQANQAFGQVETGYRLNVGPASVTPFARLQLASTTQNGFSEWGADSLNLTVAPQTTNSVRTTLGAELQGELGPVDMRLRLGWQHDHADTARTLTAAFAGAPGNPFTIAGATPQRDAAVIGLQARTELAAATQLYARYDGELASGSDNHAFNLGVRLSW